MDFPLDWIEANILAASSIPTDMRAMSSLHSQGIRAIVSLTERPIIGIMDITAKAVDMLDIIYLHSPIPDGFAPNMGQAASILNFVDEMTGRKRPTFIHCHAGIGRTGTMLHAYYLWYGFDLEQAKKLVRARRPACAFGILSDTQREFLHEFARAHHESKPVK
ncbi:MAG TPA: dual specificity protein phosphatase family protein [Aggregatilineales bacterium]|nr:dual specificity protein phosphatase family protein [Aggregatilineales bacterium]